MESWSIYTSRFGRGHPISICKTSANCKEKKTIWQYPGILQTNEVALRTLNFPPHTYLIILLPSNQASTSVVFPCLRPTPDSRCSWMLRVACHTWWMLLPRRVLDGLGNQIGYSPVTKLGSFVKEKNQAAMFRCANDCQILYTQLQRDVLWRAGHTFLFSKNSSLSHSANESEIETTNWKRFLELTESRYSPENYITCVLKINGWKMYSLLK